MDHAICSYQRTTRIRGIIMTSDADLQLRLGMSVDEPRKLRGLHSRAAGDVEIEGADLELTPLAFEPDPATQVVDIDRQ